MRYDPGGDTEFQLARILNGGLEFGDNFRCAMVEFTTTGEQQEVEHNLGYPPSGFIIISKDGEGEVWSSDLELWTTNKVLLQSNVTNLNIRAIVL